MCTACDALTSDMSIFLIVLQWEETLYTYICLLEQSDRQNIFAPGAKSRISAKHLLLRVASEKYSVLHYCYRLEMSVLRITTLIVQLDFAVGALQIKLYFFSTLPW